MHSEANYNYLAGQSPRYISLCFLSLIKQSGTKTMNKQFLTAPVRLEEVHFLH